MVGGTLRNHMSLLGTTLRVREAGGKTYMQKFKRNSIFRSTVVTLFQVSGDCKIIHRYDQI